MQNRNNKNIEPLHLKDAISVTSLQFIAEHVAKLVHDYSFF